jgi:hypothetical protein
MFGSSASVAERGICPGPRAVVYDPRGGHGHVSFRATWVEPAVANDITTKNASAVERARACRPDQERDKLSGTQGSMNDAGVAACPSSATSPKLQERHEMTQTLDRGIKSEHSEAERTRGNERPMMFGLSLGDVSKHPID